jgi:hypothetical protein
MLPLKKKPTRESTASFKVNLLGLETGALANTVGRSTGVFRFLFNLTVAWI